MNLYILYLEGYYHKKNKDNKEQPWGKSKAYYKRLVCEMGDDLDPIMNKAINEMTSYMEALDDFDDMDEKPHIVLKRKFSIKDILSDLSVKLPELVKNAVEREQLEKIAEVLGKEDSS